MNGKIRELAKLAGMSFVYEYDSSIVMDVEDLEKFAELIINECIKICDDTENEYLSAESEQLLGEDNHKFAIGAGVCCNRIKLKFGIE